MSRRLFHCPRARTVAFCPRSMCGRRCGPTDCVCRPCTCGHCRPSVVVTRRGVTIVAVLPRRIADVQIPLFATNQQRRTAVKKLLPYRQGDVLVAPVTTIPEGLQAVPLDRRGRLVLAYGEATGHAHVVVGEAELFAADVAELEERFLRVEREARLIHDEHSTIVLPPGNYRVRRQREYAPEANQWVAD